VQRLVRPVAGKEGARCGVAKIIKIAIEKTIAHTQNITITKTSPKMIAALHVM